MKRLLNLLFLLLVISCNGTGESDLSGLGADSSSGTSGSFGEFGNSTFTFNPTSINFGTVTMSSTSQQTLSIKNSSSYSIYINSLSIAGSDFSLNSSTCSLAPAAMSAGSTCQFNVSFSPTSVSTQVTHVVISFGNSSSDTTKYSATYSVTGTGISALSFNGLDSITRTYQYRTADLKLDWTVVAGAQSYRVYDLSSGSRSLVTTLSSGTSTYTVTDVALGQTKTYAVFAVDSSGYEDGNTVQRSEVLAANNGLSFAGISSISNITGFTMQLNWSDIAGESGYAIFRESGGTYTLVGTTAADSTNYTVENLLTSTSYTFYVYAFDGDNLYDGNTISGTDTTSPFGVTVSATYPTFGQLWMSYVKNDGTTFYDATDTTCSTGADTKCIHAGEVRKATVVGKSNCTNLTATDSLGVFDWTCVVVSGNATFYSQLKEFKGLRDLVDATSFKSNSLTVKESGVTLGATTSSVWWTNSVKALPNNNGGSALIIDGVDDDGAGVDEAFSSGDILTVSSSYTTPGYQINMDDVAIVTLGSYELSHPNDSVLNCNHQDGTFSSPTYICILSISGQSRVWIESKINGVGTSMTIISGSSSNYVRIHNSEIYSSGSHGVYTYTSRQIIVSSSLFHNSTSRGVHLYNSDYTQVFQNRFYENYDGIYQTNCSYNEIYENHFYSNSNAGFMTHSSGSHTDRNRIYDNIFANNTNGIILGRSNVNYIYNNSISNSSSYGVTSSDTANYIYFVKNYLIGNSSGFYSGSYTTAPSRLVANTYMNNGMNYLIRGTDGFVHNMLSLGSGVSTNLYIHKVYSSTFSDIALSTGGNNIGTSTNSDTNNRFTGLLMLHAAVSNNCYVQNAVFTLDDGTCANDSNSDATLSTTFNFTDSFVGKVSSDSSNTSHVSGAQSYNSITDWTNFESEGRGWGRSIASLPSTIGERNCTSGGGCQIYDARLSSSDTVVLNRSGDGVNLNNTFVSGANCPSELDGNNIYVSELGVNYMAKAMEIMGDSIGDDDGLCESNEACLYMPNFGAYQGHGDYTSNTCTFQDGTISGVTMYAYPNNGI